ncbi:GNAT family N-acetyltransferase [Algibacter pacificus]|uniref:GNAT family N-acetyltransferase n=1 Tax=Algibacter pacificus TaxID=2599389 RepID=UPI0011C929CE|nr:GNAT family N-acetyltransferase [Algibacter pacificus]
MVKIIKATVNDSALISKLGSQTFLEAHGDSGTKSEIENFLAEIYHENAIAKEFENQNVLYYLILFNDKVAGYSKIEIQVGNELVEAENIAKLDRFYLLKEFYGQNLGLQFLKFNIEIAKQNAQTGLWLRVWTKNIRAIKFYEKNGFKNVGGCYFKISDTRINPNHTMYLEF